MDWLDERIEDVVAPLTFGEILIGLTMVLGIISLWGWVIYAAFQVVGS